MPRRLARHFWWRRVDSNHRSESQQIYSLPPLATRELLHIQLAVLPPNRSPAERVRFGEEAQRRERAFALARKRAIRSLRRRWSWWTDSNPRPADYKSAALPTELHQRISSSTAGVILSERRCFVKGKSCYFHIFSGRGRNYPHTGVDRPAAGRAAGMAGGLLPPVPGGAVRRGAGPVPPVPRAPFPGETGEAGGYL